jgi:hypothetical protein
MKVLTATVVVFAMLLRSTFAQSSTAATNIIRAPEVLQITTGSNAMSISNAFRIASGLRVGMTMEAVANYMHAHGIYQTNLYSISTDRGRTMSCPWGNLLLDIECSQPPASGLFGWKNPVLKRAYVQIAGTNIVSITLTNSPPVNRQKIQRF